MAEARKRFPDDIDFTVPVDTTKAVNEGMKEIVETLLIAIALVAAVVYLFLQGWRATLIPLLAVPVSLVGTFHTVSGIRIQHQHTIPVRFGARHRL